MINRFREKFGLPKEVAILMGDFGAKCTLKGSETVKGKSIRKLFKNAGYQLCLVDEYNTSKYMNGTGELLEKFRKRKSPKPYKKEDQEQLVHGLLRITSETSNSCKDCKDTQQNKTTLINRDLNGALNILTKGKCIIRNQEIPTYLERKQQKEQVEIPQEKQEKQMKVSQEKTNGNTAKRTQINQKPF